MATGANADTPLKTHVCNKKVCTDEKLCECHSTIHEQQVRRRVLPKQQLSPVYSFKQRTMPAEQQGRFWVFTLNNPTDAEKAMLSALCQPIEGEVSVPEDVGGGVCTEEVPSGDGEVSAGGRELVTIQPKFVGLVQFIIWGDEIGESGTPHLQGYIEFFKRQRHRRVCRILGGRAHVERRHGTAEQAITYCRKVQLNLLH